MLDGLVRHCIQCRLTSMTNDKLHFSSKLFWLLFSYCSDQLDGPCTRTVCILQFVEIEMHLLYIISKFLFRDNCPFKKMCFSSIRFDSLIDQVDPFCCPPFLFFRYTTHTEMRTHPPTHRRDAEACVIQMQIRVQSSDCDFRKVEQYSPRLVIDDHVCKSKTKRLRICKDQSMFLLAAVMIEYNVLINHGL